jgi:serine/threonine-protein kinase HipA
MSLNGKRDDFTANDFTACEKAIAMKRGRGLEILEEVQQAVLQWPEFASSASVPAETTRQIATAHHTEISLRE